MDIHTKVGNLIFFGMTSSTTSCTVVSVFLIVATHKKDQKGTNEVHTVGMPANDEGYRIQDQICTAIRIHLDEIGLRSPRRVLLHDSVRASPS